MPLPVSLETFPNLSLSNTDPNYAVTQINSFSRFLQVPASYVPPGTSPYGLPRQPHSVDKSLARLISSTPAAAPYLTVQAANPLAWPPAFGVLAQGNQQEPDEFNLLVVYNPPSGEGVASAGPCRTIQQRHARQRRGHVRRQLRTNQRPQLLARAEPQPLGLRTDALRRQPGLA